MRTYTMGYRERSEAGILLAGDIGVFFLALWVTLFVRYFAFPESDLYSAHIVPFSILSCFWVMVFFIAGLYDRYTEFVERTLLSTILQAQGINILIAIVFFFFVPFFGITPKVNLLIYLCISSVLLVAWRVIFFPSLVPRVVRRGLLVGDGEEIEELVREVNRNPRFGLEFVRVLNRDAVLASSDLETKLHTLIAREKISVVVADARDHSAKALIPIFFNLMFAHRRVQFVDLATMYEKIFNRVPLSLLDYDWFLTHAARSSHPLYDVCKRCVDIAGALICGVVLVLITPLVWLLMRIEDGGPLFITQQRMGVSNTKIHVYKFRTMRSNENGVWLGESKNTVTRLGAFLRKTSIDELPQVWNILRGEMSLIGPRNDMEGLAARLAEEIPFYTTRTSIKPGITGWAQTHQRYLPGNISPQSVEETKMRLAYDLYYIKHRSLLLDINIALRTIKTLLGRFGVTIRLR